MTNPFDSADHAFVVLVNGHGEHSLWPANIAVPGGWDLGFGPAPKPECLDHVRDSWTDMRPAGLAGAGRAGRDEGGRS